MRRIKILRCALSFIYFNSNFSCYLGFDVGDLSENGPDDVEGMDASAVHVANLLLAEPSDSMFLF